MKKKKYKAIIHFNKRMSKNNMPWTVHYRDVCHIVSEIHCMVPMKSEWKPDKKDNPRAFFTAKAAKLEIKNGIATLS